MTRFPHYMAAMAPTSGKSVGQHAMSFREGIEYRVFTKPKEPGNPSLFAVSFSEAPLVQNSFVVNTEDAPEAVDIHFALQHKFSCPIADGFLVMGVVIDIEGFKEVEDLFKGTLVSITSGCEKITKGVPLGTCMGGGALPLDSIKEQLFGVKMAPGNKGGFPEDKFGVFLTNATDFSVDILKFPHQLKDTKVTITVQVTRYTSRKEEVRDLTEEEIAKLGDEAVEVVAKEKLQIPKECPKCNGGLSPGATPSFGITGTPQLDKLTYSCLKCKDWETTLWDAAASVLSSLKVLIFNYCTECQFYDFS